MGDEEQVIRIGGFLAEKIGVEIVATVLTDALKKDEEHETKNDELLKYISKNVYKTVDQKEINDIIRGSKPEVIFASALESHVASKLDRPLVEISYPIVDKLIIGKTTVGVRGLVTIIEDYFTVNREFENAKRDRLVKELKNETGNNQWYEKEDSYSRVRSNKGLYFRKQEFSVSNG